VSHDLFGKRFGGGAGQGGGGKGERRCYYCSMALLNEGPAAALVRWVTDHDPELAT